MELEGNKYSVELTNNKHRIICISALYYIFVFSVWVTKISEFHQYHFE